MGFRIAVDLDLCQGHGVCEMEAPDLFEVGKDRKVHVLVEHPDESHRKGAEQAVKFCPTHALEMIDD